jgi:two-component system, NarL family, sensor kinase
MDTHEASIYTAVIITAIVFGCIIIYFVISLYVQHRKRIRIQRRYFYNEVNLLEKERFRLGRDLHDELGPGLSMTMNHLEEIMTDDASSTHHKKKAGMYLKNVMERIGEIAINLAPSTLQRKGLKFAIQDFIDSLDDVSFIEFEFKYDIETEIDKSMDIHLFRIVQELCHNAVKHSEASKVLVQLKEKEKKIYLYYSDNGRGLKNDKKSINGKGIGMGSIKSRTELLAGKMRLQTSEQGGTSYLFEFSQKKISL